MVRGFFVDMNRIEHSTSKFRSKLCMFYLIQFLDF